MRRGKSGSELSRRLELAALRDGAVERTIEANAAEREALAARFGIEAVERFVATVTAEPRQRGELVIVHGRLEARVRQVCVVSLDSFESDIAESFEERFVPRRGAEGPDEAAELTVDPLEPDPEPVTGDSIDLGELVAQTLSLALDPYPRKPGVRFDPGEEPADGPGPEDGARRRPFDTLARLRK